MQFYFQHPDRIGELNHTLIVLVPKVERPCLMKQYRPIALCNSVYKGLSKFLANKIKPLLAELVSPNQFIRAVLEDLKLPGDMVGAIMGCVTSHVLEVLWNAVRNLNFQSQRGIRQGDPISPYLFVLCMEKLTHLIMDEVEVKNWQPIRAGKSEPPISHLMFADDIILFAEASLSQLNCIAHFLQKFSKMSGQCEVVKSIIDVSGFKKVNNLGSYLGSLMRHGRIRKDHYADNNTLPVHVCQDIEKLQRNFTWGDLDSKRRAHDVAWEHLCQPMDCGGLGIINLRIQNEAFMQKLAWQLIKDQNSLWAQVLLGKYGRNHDPNRSLIAKLSDSTLWKNICIARTKLSQHLEWVVENGKTACFWTDYWGDWQSTLLELASVKPPISDLVLKVCDVVDPSTNGWNWNYLEKYFDAFICSKLSKYSSPILSNSDDWLNWKKSIPGKSIVKNAYC
ncbi:uncharacterized protein LOC133291745 [Gastrolobium bilobum]|uniref:uncharacterized protein LOC133291745 n=1 Tax=Gastrolobium bilobum TaxID=150636 RepID=UPI002AB15A70|nr:uncharacterized protein LOC133291745 [Gastrolobium bilobum]